MTHFKNIQYSLVAFLLLSKGHFSLSNAITPFKYIEQPDCNYQIPESSRYTIPRIGPRIDNTVPDIIYYFTQPKNDGFPIAILCTGSTTQDSISSVIHFHRYFLQEFLDLGIAVLTVEQWGVDGNNYNQKEFMDHYTRSQRLNDHRALIDYLQLHPHAGWNGEIILLGVSEGGPIVTKLTQEYPDITLATVNWSGAGDWLWREDLWPFIKGIRSHVPWWFKILDALPNWIPGATGIPKTRVEYDAYMDKTIANPVTDKYFMGMTYAYHADALQWPEVNYEKIRTPFLVVSGALDSFIESSDAFVSKALLVHVPVTYMRINDMDHYIRQRPDIIEKSFEWLKKIYKGTY